MVDFRCRLIPTTERDVNFLITYRSNPDVVKVMLCSVGLIDVKHKISLWNCSTQDLAFVAYLHHSLAQSLSRNNPFLTFHDTNNDT